MDNKKINWIYVILITFNLLFIFGIAELQNYQLNLHNEMSEHIQKTNQFIQNQHIINYCTAIDGYYNPLTRTCEIRLYSPSDYSR